MVKEAEVTQKKWLTSPRLCHIVVNLQSKCPNKKKNTCVAAHAVKVGDIAPSLVKFLMTLLLVFSGFAWSAFPPSSSHLTNLRLAYPLT